MTHGTDPSKKTQIRSPGCISAGSWPLYPRIEAKNLRVGPNSLMDVPKCLESIYMRIKYILESCHGTSIDHALGVEFGQELSKVPVILSKQMLLGVYSGFGAIVVELLDGIGYYRTQ